MSEPKTPHLTPKWTSAYHEVITSAAKYRLPLPVDSFMTLTYSTPQSAHMGGAATEGSDER